MMKKAFQLILLIGIFSLGTVACSGPTLKGVELGNPDPVPTTVHITPQGGMTSYDLTLLDENNASLTRTDTQTGSKNTLIVPYQKSGSSLLLQAAFPALETIEITLALDVKGNVIAVRLKIDGQEVTSAFDTTPNLPEVNGDSGKKPEAVKFLEAPSEGQIAPQAPAPTVDLDQNVQEVIAP